MSGFKSGYGTSTIPFWAVFDLYVIFICTSIPGLAISPIMGDLQKLFPGTTQLESQFLTLGPNIMAIPFVFLGGLIGTRFNNNKLLNWTMVFYSVFGIAFFFVNSMILLIVLSFLIGICAGIISPLASAFIADMFNGKERSAQYGGTSAVLNLVLMIWTFCVGFLVKIHWRLPFIIYLLPIVPLFFITKFKKYIKEPSDIRTGDAEKNKVPKVHYKFSQQVNVPMLVRYCIYYFFITFVIAAISLYIPFQFTNTKTAGILTSILFLGIMLSGFTLNWCVKVLRGWIAIPVIAVIAGSFVLMALGIKHAWMVGIGIFLASYFYGIAQPYYYNRLSQASTRIALTLTLAIFAVMDSVGNVVAPFIIDGIAKLCHHSTSTDPDFAFDICMWFCIIAAGVVVIRQIIARLHHHSTSSPKVLAASVQGPTDTTAASVNPIPADVPLKKVDESEAALYAANDASQAAKNAGDAAARAAAAAAMAAKEAEKAAAAAGMVAKELADKPMQTGGQIPAGKPTDMTPEPGENPDDVNNEAGN